MAAQDSSTVVLPDYVTTATRTPAALTTTGDGLPQNADVKYRGVLVGSVKEVQVAALGTIQNVEIKSEKQDVQVKLEVDDASLRTVLATAPQWLGQ